MADEKIKCFWIEPVEGVYNVYRRTDNGKYVMLEDAGAGAMYDAYWMHKWHPKWVGADGNIVVVILPNGRSWCIDGQASNCTRKGEPHHCWCRHGTVPDITVNKVGDTCQAGAGSIQAEDYHGFLIDGHLVKC